MYWTAFEWFLMLLSVIGTFLVIKKRVDGFYLWVAANLGWVVFYAYKGLYASSLMFAVYLGLSLYGVWESKWKTNT